VASSGTALTPDQLRILKKHADVIILVFDSDEAGQKAISRGIELGLAAGYDVKCVALPAGQDPDSLVREQGADVLKDMMTHAPSWLQFQTERFRSLGQLDDAAQQARAVRVMLEWISQVPDMLRHPFLVRELSDAFRLNEQFLSAELQRLRSGSRQAVQAAPSVQPAQHAAAMPGVPQPPREILQPTTTAVMLPPERELIRIALSSEHGLAILLNEVHVTEKHFWSQSGRKIFRSILVAEEEHGNAAEHIIHDPSLTSDERRELADVLFAHATPSSVWKTFDVDLPEIDLLRVIRDALVKIEIHRTLQEIDVLTQQIEATPDMDERKRLVYMISQMFQRREELRRILESDTKDFSWLRDDSHS
jgi:DNA primase